MEGHWVTVGARSAGVSFGILARVMMTEVRSIDTAWWLSISIGELDPLFKGL